MHKKICYTCNRLATHKVKISGVSSIYFVCEVHLADCYVWYIGVSSEKIKPPLCCTGLIVCKKCLKNPSEVVAF